MQIVNALWAWKWFLSTFIWKIYFYNFNEPSTVFNVLSETLALFNPYNAWGVFFGPCLSSCAFGTTLAYVTHVGCWGINVLPGVSKKVLLFTCPKSKTISYFCSVSWHSKPFVFHDLFYGSNSWLVYNFIKDLRISQKPGYKFNVFEALHTNMSSVQLIHLIIIYRLLKIPSELADVSSNSIVSRFSKGHEEHDRTHSHWHTLDLALTFKSSLINSH